MATAENFNAYTTPQLASFDFDGTQFLTSETTKEGIDVNRAYFEAISKHLGSAAALSFEREQGHNHRAPAEIVKSVTNGELEPEELEDVTRKVVSDKLDMLVGQIGKPTADGNPWPRPTAGFTETWEKIFRAKQSGKPIGTAVLSAGHTHFEQRVFDYWDLPQPDMYLTDDLLQDLALNMPMHQQTKPSPFLLRMAEMVWIYRTRLSHPDSIPEKLRTVHVGDSAKKDEQLALNCGVEFIMVTERESMQAWQRLESFLGLGRLATAREAYRS